MRVSRRVTLVNRKGLHARASARFVTVAHDLPADIEVEKDGATAAGKSIMSLMMLGAAMGDTVTIHATGSSADRAVEVLCTLVSEGFGED